MESSGSNKVLHEPALLYLILCQLSQDDLLRVQRVCQTWNQVISGDSRLQANMWLHPGMPATHFDVATTRINPLLRRTFPTIFNECSFWDGFTTVVRMPSPFMNMHVSKNPALLKNLTCSTASWRKMIPCYPAPHQLLVGVRGEERGRLLLLNFSNRDMKDTKRSHPPWLTFGMLYDIAECAWHQGNPWRLHGISFDFPSASLEQRPWQDIIPQEAAVSDQLRALAKSRAGRVRLRLLADTRSEAERRELHDQAVAHLVRLQERNRKIGFCGTSFAIRNEIFTDEFHFADALSLDEIEWDEAHECDMPPYETELPGPPRPGQRSLGERLGERLCATM